MLSYPPEVQEAIILGQDKFIWETETEAAPPRGKTWYLVAAVIAILLVAYAIWTANFLFAFLVLLLSVVLILVGNEKPRKVLVQVGDVGIVWDGRLHPYRELERFAIVYQPPVTKIIYLEPRSALRPRLRIPLAEQNPLELREHLSQYLQEDLDLQSEHLSDTLARLLKI